MIDFLKAIQLDLMLVLSSICGFIAVFVLFSRFLPPKRKAALLYMQISAMLLLIFDRYAYIFRGDESTTGFWMVRICNFLVFFLTLSLIHAFNFYIYNLMQRDEEKVKPLLLKIVDKLVVAGWLLLLISQFTGLYYTFDAQNRYHRSPGFIICYLFPFTSLVLQLIVIILYYRKLRKGIRISLVIFTSVTLVASIIQVFVYGISLINLSLVGVTVVTFVFTLVDINRTVDRINRIEIKYLREEQERMEKLFVETAIALVNAIDAKDKYTHGHSTRVADYSRRIAEIYGKNEKECNEVYYAALLHDVGKIGIADHIINKEGKLNDEEYAAIKAHTTIGAQILSSIKEYPFIGIGARYHHERFDGKGYPEGLKGEDIPEIGRIIAVADAYDAMTSKRSYRDAIPQQKVREEFVKGMGTQFDPEFAKIMLHLIDLDSEYDMKEKIEQHDISDKRELVCNNYRDNVTSGVLINDENTIIRLKVTALEDYNGNDFLPSLILFDSLDGHIHADERMIRDLNYFEYAEIRFDGHFTNSGCRKIHRSTNYPESDVLKNKKVDKRTGIIYEVQAVRYKDHALISIDDGIRRQELIIALPDSSRYLYISLTGRNCRLTDIETDRVEKKIGEDHITRIAEEISYINGPEGDIPNIQIDGTRTAATVGIPVSDEMTISFHSLSLPTARLVWHCPYLTFFSSDDMTVFGSNFKEYALIRLDGENWESSKLAENRINVTKTEEFKGWDAWKQINKQGMDCVVRIMRKGRKIVTTTENAGIVIDNTTMIMGEPPEEVYVALTGDQCALTDIHISCVKNNMKIK